MEMANKRYVSFLPIGIQHMSRNSLSEKGDLSKAYLSAHVSGWMPGVH
jgi:hypothetical protein